MEKPKRPKKMAPNGGGPPKVPATKTRRIRIYPTPDQKRKLHRWMGATRWTYNQALDIIKENPRLVDFGSPKRGGNKRKKTAATNSERTETKQKGTATIESSSKFIRQRCVNKPAIVAMQNRTDRDLSWVTETPSFCRNQAVEEALQAYKTNAAKQMKQDRHYEFKVKHRSRLKDPTQCITFGSEDWGRTRGKFADLLSRNVMRACQSSRKYRTEEDEAVGQPYGPKNQQPKGRTRYNLPAKIRYDFEIVHERTTDKYFLCIPYPPEVHPEHRNDKPYRIAALDPGVRTFQTGFEQNGTAFEFGSVKNEKRILRLCQHLDSLESHRQAKRPSDPTKFGLPHKKRSSMKRACARMRDRIRNLVDELHRKTALWLSRNYNVVLIPEFQTARMAKRSEERCIGTKTARMMYTWAHYRFRQRLIHTVREYPQCRVVIVREDYTSKTCGRCGTVNRKLRAEKTYTCRDPRCGYVADRDISAARNILLRYLTEHVREIPQGSTDTIRCSPLGLVPADLTEDRMHIV